MLAALVLSIPVQASEAKVSSPPVRAELQLTIDRPIIHSVVTQTPGPNRREDPGLHATIRNLGRTPLRLIDPQDGSEAGWRNPSVIWKLPDTRRHRPGARCGDMNPIEETAFFTLAPGASREIPLHWVGPAPLEPGANRVSLAYEISANRTSGGPFAGPFLGMSPKAIAAQRRLVARYRDLTPIRLTSNVVRVTVETAP